MARPNEELSNEARKKASNIMSKIGQLPSADALIKLTSLLKEEFSHYSNNKNKEQLIKRLPNWNDRLDALSNHYSSLITLLEDYIAEEETINRVERTAARRNLRYRVGTTVLIVVTTMSAYSLGGSVDWVYLPLQQKTITYYYDDKIQLDPPKDLSRYEVPRKVISVTGSTKRKL